MCAPLYLLKKFQEYPHVGMMIDTVSNSAVPTISVITGIFIEILRCFAFAAL